MSKLVNNHSNDQQEDNLIYLFHHIHHDAKTHKVHHCGGNHSGVDYEIKHCKCGLHRINRRIATGDTIDSKLKKVKVIIEFNEECPEGGWHLESGKID